MLNDEILSKEQAEIKRLKFTIHKFKEYDEERKKYYKDILIELGQLKSYVEELEAKGNSSKSKLIKNIVLYKELCKSKELQLQTFKQKDKLMPELVQLKFYKDGYKNLKDECENLKKQNSSLKKELNKLRDDISKLIYELHTGTSGAEQSNVANDL